MGERDRLTKLKITAVLGERNTRVALLIVDMICTAMDMIEGGWNVPMMLRK